MFACEFPLYFTSLFRGSLRLKHKLFVKRFSSVLGKASPTPLNSRCHLVGGCIGSWSGASKYGSVSVM